MPDPTPRRIYLVAGEASGDAHGARLIEALGQQEPSLAFEGLGGLKMQAAGMRLDYDLAGEGIMGFVEVLKHAPRLTRLIKSTAAKLRATPPAALVLIDYPGFNIRLAKLLEGSGIPVIYYISPQVWAWKKGRIHTLAKVCRKMLVIFPFEEKLYQDVGLDVTFVGHPLVEHVAGIKNAAVGGRGKRGRYPYHPDLRIVDAASSAGDAISLISALAQGPHSDRRAALAYRKIDNHELELLRSVYGISMDACFLHTLDASALRHVYLRHGENGEKSGSESPVLQEDVVEIVNATVPANLVQIERNKRGQWNLVYELILSAGVLVVVEELRLGRKEMALVTMYKRHEPRIKLGEITGEQLPSSGHALDVRNDQFYRFSPEPTIPHSPAPGNTAHVIGLLPGSRAQEIARVFPPMLKLARDLAKQRPGLRFVAPCMNNARADQIRKLAKDFPLDILVGGMHDVLSTARFCLVASGTATLETAVFGVPMIILYRVSPITYALARLLVDIKHIGMVNILAGREVVPEHVQSICVPHILPQALSLIDDTPARQQMLQDLDAVRQMLGEGGASQRAAQEILAVLNNGTP